MLQEITRRHPRIMVKDLNWGMRSEIREKAGKSFYTLAHSITELAPSCHYRCPAEALAVLPPAVSTQHDQQVHVFLNIGQHSHSHSLRDQTSHSSVRNRGSMASHRGPVPRLARFSPSLEEHSPNPHLRGHSQTYGAQARHGTSAC